MIRKILPLFIVLFCAHSFIHAQNKDYLIVFKTKADLDQLALQFESKNVPVPVRAKTVIHELLKASQISKQSYSNYLESLQILYPNQVENIEYHWIVNCIVITCTPEFALKASQHNEVEGLEDLSHLFFRGIPPVSMQPAPPNKAIGAAEPGLDAVNARGMWSLGYTGLGRVLLSFDTGVWINHPALGGRFLGNFMPLAQTWHGFFGATPVDKSNSHGTHTIGTMAGLDASNQDTIGMAFKAYFIATDPIVQQLADTLPYTSLLEAYEWAINPDGDTATTNDIPDVICNSWGKPGGTDSALCGGVTAQILVAIDLIGIANEYSAGNEGPGDTTIGFPAMFNPSLYNAFSVGAVDGNNLSLPIADFSSRGPSICATGGSQQIKPEVVAPGVNVRSCIGQNGWGLYSGTSMAGPHVAGALVLLKEAFPYLPGTILKQALYETAHDLGVPGEDNTFGNGIIDVRAAFDWLAQTYTPVPPNSSPYDIAISGFTSPVGPMYCDSIIFPQIKVKNQGSMAVPGVEITCRNIQTGLSQVQAFPGQQILPGEELTFTLNPQLANAAGKNEFWAYVRSLNSVVESDTINNSGVSRYLYMTRKYVQYFEGFETGNMSDRNIYIDNPDANKTWDTASTEGLYNSHHSAVMHFTGYGPPSSQQDRMILPRIAVPATGNLTMAFDLAYQYKLPTKNDSLFVDISFDCGKTFPYRLYAKGNDSLATVTGVNPSIFVPDSMGDWKNQRVSLDQFVGVVTDITIAFTSQNKAGGNLYIDNIFVFQGADPVSVENFEQVEFKLFPNPSEGFVILNSSEAFPENAQLKIMNLEGRTIRTSLLPQGAKQVELDLSELSQGMYFVLIQYKNTQKVLKMLRVGR